MILSTLDSITRRYLLERGLPIHWYIETMTWISTGLRELSFDSLQIINAVNLVVNDYGASDLPDDFVDDLSVCIPAAGVLQPIPKNDSINPLRMHDTTTGAFLTQNQPTSPASNNFLGTPNWFWFWNIDSYGSPTGRNFGAKGGAYSNGYKVVKQRRQIQLTNTFTNQNIVLLYISDGQRADNATQIDVQAISALQSFVDWKSSKNRANVHSPEGVNFMNEKRMLRARLNPLTKTDIINILRNTYSASLKN